MCRLYVCLYVSLPLCVCTSYMLPLSTRVFDMGLVWKITQNLIFGTFKFGYLWLRPYFKLPFKWDISLWWGVSAEWDTFYPGFTRGKHPTWVRCLSSHLTCMPIFNYQCHFRCLLKFLLLFQFWVTNEHLHCSGLYSKLHFLMQ